MNSMDLLEYLNHTAEENPILGKDNVIYKNHAYEGITSFPWKI